MSFTGTCYGTAIVESGVRGLPSSGRPRLRSGEAPAQNVKRKPSWIWRLGKAEVKVSGVLDVAVPPPRRAEPGLIPFTLNVVNPGSNPRRGLTSLFTLA